MVLCIYQPNYMVTGEMSSGMYLYHTAEHSNGKCGQITQTTYNILNIDMNFLARSHWYSFFLLSLAYVAVYVKLS